MQVRQLLDAKHGQGIITIDSHADVATAARLLMRYNIGGLVVVRSDGSLVGFLSERDIVRAVNRGTAAVGHMSIEEVTRRPAPTCSVDDDLNQVMGRMNRERLRHLVVMDGDRVAGILSVGDLIRHRVEELETEAGVLRDYVVAQRARG